jgi:hypothetical protein
MSHVKEVWKESQNISEVRHESKNTSKNFILIEYIGPDKSSFRFNEPTPGQPTKRKTKRNEKENRKMTKETKTKQLK